MIPTKIDLQKINKVLVIKLRGIGDVVCSSIVIDNLRNQFRDAQIDYLVEKPSSFGLNDVLELNNVLIFDRDSLLKKIKLALKIRRSKYDLVIDFFGNPSSAQITYLSNAYYRVGFPFRGRKYAYNIFGPSERVKWHNAELHLKVLEQIGINSPFRVLKYSLSNASKLFAEKYFTEMISSNDFVIGICPTGSWQSKKCDPAKIEEIANKILQKYSVKFLILWGKGDEVDAYEIKRLLGDKAIIAPETTIQQMAALIGRCNFLIANDSGPMHISTALGTPVLSIHGPTSPFVQGPYGDKHEWINLPELDCIECNLLVCPKNHECFMQIPIEKIMEKIEALIRKNQLRIPIIN